jgi:uncharacterized RDD family membrane protein YckC
MIARDNNKITGHAVAAPPRASHREWIGLAVLALPALLISMDLSVLYLAVPHLSAALRPSSAQLLWITDIYGFLLAGFLISHMFKDPRQRTLAVSVWVTSLSAGGAVGPLLGGARCSWWVCR